MHISMFTTFALNAGKRSPTTRLVQLSETALARLGIQSPRQCHLSRDLLQMLWSDPDCYNTIYHARYQIAGNGVDGHTSADDDGGE